MYLPTPDSQSGHCRSLGANKGEVMLILNYLKFKNGLPYPISPLFLRLTSQAIALANSEVTKATNDSSKKTWPIQEVSLKHRLNTSKLFWTPPCFTISTWSQLKVPSHYYSTLAFSYCMSICTKNFQHKKLTSENVVTWNILELWCIRTVAHYTNLFHHCRGLKMWHRLPKCMHSHPNRKYAETLNYRWPTYSGQVAWEGSAVQ